MALSPEVCTAVGASGLDSSGAFRLPDVDSLDTAAGDLTTHAASFRSGLDAAARTWSGLGASYVSEESPTVLAAFGQVSPLAERVSDDAQLTASALSAFSSTCRELRQRLEAYGRSVRELDADIDAFPTSVEETTMVKGEQIKTQVQQHWSGDADLTARHDGLAADVKAIHTEYVNAQDSCAAAMAAVSGAETYRSERIGHADLRSGNWITEGLFNAGTFFGIQDEENQNPWGQDTVAYRPNGVLGELQGFGAGAVMLVDGVWSLIPGVSNQTKHDRAVEGIKTLVTDPGSIDWGAAWEDFIHLDDADTNLNWAVGAVVFNVGSLFVGGGAGAGLKAGSVAGKAGLAAEKLSIATMDSPRLGKFSSLLGGTAQGLYTTGAFLSKPGSLALKVSDLVMPQSTAKVLDSLTAIKVNAWMAVDKAPAALWDHGVARPLEGASVLLRATDQALPTVAVSPGGAAALGQGSMGRMADGLDSTAAHVRADHVPAPPKTQVAAPLEHFPKPEAIKETVVLRHADVDFPISKKDNFAARTGLKPDTEYVVEHRTQVNHVTGKAVDSVEKYYTDATGKVDRVDTYAGVRGGWSTELNRPAPNVTYNVVAKVDGGLENTFTYTTDAAGHAQSVSGKITSTFAGNMNRNAWQQLLAGKRVGGPGYEGGHSAPSFLGAPGERIGLFAQHQYQNRGFGAPNVGETRAKFYRVEEQIRDQVKKRLETGQPVDLDWAMSTPSGGRPGLPDTFTLEYGFDGAVPESLPFNNLMK